MCEICEEFRNKLGPIAQRILDEATSIDDMRSSVIAFYISVAEQFHDYLSEHPQRILIVIDMLLVLHQMCLEAIFADVLRRKNGDDIRPGETDCARGTSAEVRPPVAQS